jgi:hypothetical protein
MPTIQSTYADNVDAGYAGAIVNTEPRTLISRTVEDAAGIGFGEVVMQGTNDKGCVIGDGTGFLGVTVRDQSVTPENPNLFAQYEEARIMTKGVVWVVARGTVAAGDEVALDTSGGLAAATSGDIPGARWDTSASDGELAQLRLA